MTRKTTRIERYLLEHPEGARSLEVAREALGLSGPDDLLARLGETYLETAPGARRDDCGLWRLERSGTASFVALAGVATGPYPEWDLLLEVGAATVRDDRVIRTFSAFVRRSGPLPPAARALAGPSLSRLSEGLPLPAVLRALRPLVEGAEPLSFDDDDAARFVLRSLGGSPEPGPVRRLAPALRRAGILGRGEGLADAAAALGLPVPVLEDAAGAAEATAAVFLAMTERGVALDPPPGPPAFDFTRTAFGPELLDRIPSVPGVYRFFDREARLLYVGKARNLRRRISGYFGRRRERRRLFAGMMERLHHLEWEETGSEIAALLAESREIREKEPPFNVQRAVHRRRGAAGDLALLLPGPDPREVEILLLRDGVPAGRAAADRRGRGMRRVRDALRRAFFSGAPPPAADGDAQILATWLHLESDRVNSVDLSQVAGMNDAARRIRTALTDPDLFRRKTFYR